MTTKVIRYGIGACHIQTMNRAVRMIEFWNSKTGARGVMEGLTPRQAVLSAYLKYTPGVYSPDALAKYGALVVDEGPDQARLFDWHAAYVMMSFPPSPPLRS